jgi:hypothetical protein
MAEAVRRGADSADAATPNGTTARSGSADGGSLAVVDGSADGGGGGALSGQAQVDHGRRRRGGQAQARYANERARSASTDGAV